MRIRRKIQPEELIIEEVASLPIVQRLEVEENPFCEKQKNRTYQSVRSFGCFSWNEAEGKAKLNRKRYLVTPRCLLMIHIHAFILIV